MNFTPQLVALLVILLFAALFLLAVRANRRVQIEKTHQALTLGYQEVTTRPSQLLSRMEALYWRGENQGIRVDQVYTKREGEEELFLFDVSRSPSEDNQLGSEVFGVISSQLALPHFSITTLPGFSSDTFLGSIMDSILDNVLSSLSEKYLGMSRIEFPDRPDLDDQLIVFGKDQGAVRDLLERINLDAIIRIKSPLHVAGVDDFLTVDFSQMAAYSSQDSDLIAQQREFSRIYDMFKN